MDINGAAAIVTGGASGLGAGTAERLARAGAKVTIFDLNAELGMVKAKEIGGYFASVDVTDEQDVRSASAQAEEVNGKTCKSVNWSGNGPAAYRSEWRRGGEECGSTGRSRGLPW